MRYNFIREILNNSKDILVFDRNGVSNLNFDQIQELPAFVYLLEQTLYKKIEKVVYRENKVNYSIILEDELYEIELNENILFKIACVIYEQSSDDENSFPALVTLKFDWKLNLIEFLVNSNHVDFEIKTKHFQLR